MTQQEREDERIERIVREVRLILPQERLDEIKETMERVHKRISDQNNWGK